jgi:peptidoglycan/LPS O-acetylase OafA/YrhL
VGLIALGASLCALAALGPFVKGGPAFLVYWTSPIILEFGAGLAIGYLYHKGVRAPLALAVVMAVVGLALAGVAWPPLDRALICGGPAALIVAAAALGPNPTRLNLLTQPLVAGGDASYAIYLSHIFTINACSLVFSRLGIDNALLFLSAALVGSVAVGAVTRLMVEKPLLRWSRKHGIGRVGRGAVVVRQPA